ncbi:MAG: U32 family peptidase [Rhodoferax sp.]|uniref:U32 family peptidase n=1 Tax=Rhodoferax sp. TaxID=50421 RepID=UPI0027306D73|nr:U32 family peptidase [Rhodoferax sp.]MDP1529395.1 U32 family peptidase [Rhodoferax sp.]MDP2056291.1 U32 family peptidase [Thiobacillus sp.]
MNLSLGPLLYYWSRDDVLAFYDEAKNWAVARVYLGESVCSRRHLLRLSDWLELAEQLTRAGKEVVLASQALIESESDLKTLRRIVGDGRFRVEANEWGAVRLLSEAGVPFVAGPTLNVYNHETLDVLAELGAQRWLPPVEMSRATLASLLERAPAAIETEVFAYGRLPLAYSARCFTARHYNLPKDDCQFRCLDHPDGLPLATREGAPFLTLNGIQTQSASVYTLIGELPALRELDIASLRLSPQSRHMGRVVEAFQAALAGEREAASALARIMPGPPVDGYWHGRAGLEYGTERSC